MSNIRHNQLKTLQLTLVFLLAPLFIFAQTLTGLWTGTFSNDSNSIRKDQSYEIALTEYRGKVYGYSRSEFIVNDTLYYIVKRVKGKIEGDVCEVKDDEILAYNFRGRLDKGVKVSSFFYRNKSDSSWYLAGKWKTNTTKRYYAVTGKVQLKEEKDLSASKLFPHLEELNLINDVAFYKEKKKEPEAVVIRKVEPEKKEPLEDTIMAIAEKPAIKPIEKNTAAINNSTNPAIEIANKKEEPKNLGSIIESPKKDKEDLKPGLQASTAIVSTKPESIASTQVNKPEKTEPVPVKDEPKKPEQQIITSNQPKETSLVENKKPAQPVTTTNETKQPPVFVDNKKAEQTPIITKAPRQLPLVDNKKTEPKIIIPDQTKPIPQKESIASINKPADKSTNIVNTAVTTNNNPAPVKEPQTPIETKKEIKVEPTTESKAMAALMGTRKSEFSQEVDFKSDSLELALYDNGEIDGDTVSIFFNGEVLMAKQGLKATAIKKTIYLTKGKDDEFTLVLFADNLGKYPPNTGLLVVHDGDDVYNVRFSADLQKNAGVIFRRKK